MKLASFVIALIFPFAASAAAHMTLQSASFKDGARLPDKHVFSSFGCTGQNVSPQLEWKNAPKGTKSFAITVYDPDAPTGSGWWHWTVYNIPHDVMSLQEGASGNPNTLPKGAAEGRTDYGKAGYGGACPPVGDKPHRYIFTVFALKTDKLDLPADASAAMLGFQLNFNSLAKASVTARYGR